MEGKKVNPQIKPSRKDKGKNYWPEYSNVFPSDMFLYLGSPEGIDERPLTLWKLQIHKSLSLKKALVPVPWNKGVVHLGFMVLGKAIYLNSYREH